VKLALILDHEAENVTYLIELDVRKALEESILQISEELRVQPCLEWTISKSRVKAVRIFKYISWLSGSFFWEAIIGVFSKNGVKTCPTITY
jgi:hypothetical protein